MNQGALAQLDTKGIIARYLADENTKDIAKSLGVHRSALNQHLLKFAKEDWVCAQAARAITRKEQAEEDLASSVDSLSLARAREVLRSAQWDLERVARRIFGTNVEMVVEQVLPERDITQVARRLAFLLAKGIDAGEVVDEVVTIDQTPSIESDTPK